VNAPPRNLRLVGRGVSEGVAIGRAVVAVRDAAQVRYRLAASGVDRERQRLRVARQQTRQQLEEISSRIARTVGSAQAAIFAAQLLMLDDPMFSGRVETLIRTERINADWALERAIAEVHAVFEREGDAWLRERVGDLADVGGRLLRNLRPGRDPLVDIVHEQEGPLIIVADEVSPSVAALLDWSKVQGLVADVGSPTHHTVILLRSVGVPAVVGLGRATQIVAPGDTVAIDGATGEVVIEPADDVVVRWSQRAQVAAAAHQKLDELRSVPAVTADGVDLRLDANLELADDVGRVLDAGAAGIGLYRSEFLLDRPGGAAAMDEATQVDVYRRLLRAMAPRPVTIRTFDSDDDRSPVVGRVGHRDRFGVRGIRAALQHDERFTTQIRALLRAASEGQLRILLPFVSLPSEFRQVRQLIADIARGVPGAPTVQIGAMIEVPSAALMVDRLAHHADFLSVGTNDLIQYTLAIDRTDERLAGHYEPCEPAVLRLLRMVASAGRRTGKDLSVCGEMAADPLMVALLVGLGFRSFSMTPASIPVVKRGVRAIHSRVARRVARAALLAESAEAVHIALAPLAAAMTGES
jgi:phosphotransferase system enzyme I (PtsI)